jgi:DNA-binding Lrp family transcriptional regulator
MFKRLLIYNLLSHLPKKIRNGEPKNNSSGDYDTQPPLNNEYPSKYNNKSKFQKNSTKKSRRESSSRVQNSAMLTNDSRNITNENRFSLDMINLKIITELMNKGDIKSSEIAAKLKVPLSTIQRRRTRIEKSLLKKQYKMDLAFLGYRSALIFVDVQRGKAKQTGEELLKRFDKNIVNASTRINSNNNLCLEVVYASSDDLHYLLEEIKSLPVAAKVDWSEQVTVIGDNLAKIIKANLTDKLEEMQAPNIFV